MKLQADQLKVQLDREREDWDRETNNWLQEKEKVIRYVVFLNFHGTYSCMISLSP